MPYSVRVDGHGVVPTGEVTILDGRMVIATITLTAADDGRTTVTLPAFARGIHLVTAKFGGNDQLTP
ncbi:Ig-like domain-containing protein [Lacisediminihabitans sp.]|uniref:Ig-like domain-containing protein n=1 Tax=Lacisediminihabitans sp. TaxID=2787631 RepID=UPI002F91D048